MAIEMTPNALARALSQDTTQVYYSFWGSPCVTASGPRGTLDAYLDDIATTACRAHHEVDRGRRQLNDAMDYVAINFLIVKVHNLYELADQQIAAANIITRLFIAIRSFLAMCVGICGNFGIRHSYEFYGLGQNDEAVPNDLVRSDPFFFGISPEGGFGDDKAWYSPEQISTIYQRYLAQNAGVV